MSVSIYPIAFIDAFKSIIWQEEVEVSYRIELCIKHFELFLNKSSNNKCNVILISDSEWPFDFLYETQRSGYNVNHMLKRDV